MIDGGIKFFEENKLKNSKIEHYYNEKLIDNYTLPYILSTDKTIYWSSLNESGKDDLLINFFEEISLNRILMINHNINEYRISCRNHDSWERIDNKSTVCCKYDGTCTYIELEEIRTNQLKIEFLSSSGVLKRVQELIVTKEIGTFEGYPILNSINFDKGIKNIKSINGKMSSFDSTNPIFSCEIDFRDYPEDFQSDIDLMLSLMDLNGFYIWPCGGDYESPMLGMGPNDLFYCRVIDDLSYSFSKNIYHGGVNFKVQVHEVVN